MKHVLLYAVPAFVTMLLPAIVHAQADAGGVDELHAVLEKVRTDMIPLAGDMIKVCQAIACLGCIFYIGVRVWSKIASAQPVELYPLLRPCVITLLIGIFPLVLQSIDGILKPTVTATSEIVTHYNDAVHALLIVQAQQIVTGDNTPVLASPGTTGDHGDWDKYAEPDNTTSDSDGGLWSAIGAGFKFIAGGIMSAIKLIFRVLLSVLLELLYYAASLCIDTLRTFHLIVLAILGPFAFAFSCFDGTQNSLQQWLTRYINIYLWLPIANIFGAILAKIQLNMLQLDLERVQSGATTLFSATDFAYLIFLAIGIVGYFTVPGIANYIVHAHGPNPIAKTISTVSNLVVTGAVAGAVGGSGGAGAVMATGGSGGGSGSGGSSGGGFTGSAQSSQYNRDRITG